MSDLICLNSYTTCTGAFYKFVLTYWKIIVGYLLTEIVCNFNIKSTPTSLMMNLVPEP